MRLLSAREAADHLGVSPRRIRQMLSDGTLDGHRVGRGWVIEERAIRAVAACRRPAHRPWTARSAWSVLALADGMEPRCNSYERSRAERRLAVGLPNLLDRLGSRARILTFYAHPGTRDRIAVRPGVVRTGASASPEHGLGIVGSGPLDAYLRDGDLQAIRDAFVLEERSVRPNVMLRVVDDGLWPFPEGATVAPPAVVAVDLLESQDERSRRVGTELLQHL